jgi:RNA ligase (TIGR02306 family)
MRKLASIQRILNVRPIEGADKIEVVDVLGWSVVVKKDEFKVGDLVVYFEVDSFLPSENPAFAFLEDRFTNWGTKRGCRLKTIKLRKQLSQGLVLSVSDFSELAHKDGWTYYILEEGKDVTSLLNIEKWEPIEETNSNAGGINKTAGAGKFPSFLRKTDQERVQNYVNELEKHLDETFEVSIKLDGSSMTVFVVHEGSEHFEHIAKDIKTRELRKKNFIQKIVYKVSSFLGIVKAPKFFSGVCSRNLQLGINEGNHFSQYVREHDLIQKIYVTGKNYAVQGELIAPSIQNNYEKVSNFEFYVYDVFDIDAQRYLLPAEARSFTAEAGLKYVPVLQEDFSFSELKPYDNYRQLVDKILDRAEGPGMNKGVKREGIVLKSNSSEFSFKAISNSYLLKAV